MKSIAINLFSIDELNQQAQEVALEHHRHINIYHRWWEDDYEDFKTLCATMGITVEEIFFRGFYSQGDGSTFSSTIDVSAFIRGVAEQVWKKDFPTLELDIEKCPIHPRVIDLIESGVDIEISMMTDTHHRYYFVHYYSSSYLNNTNGRKHSRIEEELDKLDKWAKETLDTLNHYLYKNLEETCDYLKSDDAVKEAIEANQYLFTKEGDKADSLLILNTETV